MMATQARDSTVVIKKADETVSPPPTSGPCPPVNSTILQSRVAGNPEGPDSRFQVFQKCLLEHEFDMQDAFVSARVQRIQHGSYSDPDRLKFYGTADREMKVTFVAVTFAFHPMHSVRHRFQRAVINVFASDDKQRNLKFIKFAPHLAYGRISTETLHWTFSLASTIGVTLPLNASVQPSTTVDREKVIDAMLKIQGSTRTYNGVESAKMVWSLEENQQQSGGLPREFTFIFLLERPDPTTALRLAVSIRPVFSKDIGTEFLPHDPVGGQWVNLGTGETGQRFTTTPVNFATMDGNFEDLIELPGNAATIADMPIPGLASASPST